MSRLMNKKSYLTVSLAMLTLGAISSCAKKSTAAGSAGSTVNVKVLNFAKDAGTVKFQKLPDLFGTLSSVGGPEIFSVGTNNATQLTSLQYAFNAISMCQEVTTTSSFGFSAEKGCIGAYSNPVASMADETITPGDFVTKYGSSTNVFDLMNSADLTRLSSAPVTITTDQVGDYNYAVLTWVPMIGVEGSVTLADSSTLSTTALTATGITNLSSNVSAMAGATPALTYVQSANGGMVTKFQKPLSIAANTAYSLNVIFNPAGVLKGCSASTSGNITDGTNSIAMPMLPVTAILLASTDALMRESYTVMVNATFNVRVDLYYLKSDAALNVIAATITDLPTNNDAQCFGGDHRVLRVVTQADQSLSFYVGTDDSSLMLSGLLRNTITSNNVTFATGSNYTGLPAAATSGTVTAVTTTQY